MIKNKQGIELVVLRIMLAAYIIMALILAGLNFGYAEQAPADVAALINRVWHFYENWIKTIFIAVGGYLTLRITGFAKKPSLRRKNLQGFLIFALIVHIAGPYLFSNPDLYYFAMPLPWTNLPLQLLVPESAFYKSFLSNQGIGGITATLIFYLLVTIVVFGGTIIKGRRWQCSTLCLFNGFASEVFAPAFPLAGKPKKTGPGLLKAFTLLRWLFLLIAFFFTFYWLLIIAGAPVTKHINLLSQLETYKYLIFDLLAAMLFWVIFTGRGYCYYCPVGTVVGLLGRAAGQRITTDTSECINCGKCNKACPMSIDINKQAVAGKVVINLNCVGCGHCIDTCPTGTLSYVTRLSGSLRSKPQE